MVAAVVVFTCRGSVEPAIVQVAKDEFVFAHGPDFVVGPVFSGRNAHRVICHRLHSCSLCTLRNKVVDTINHILRFVCQRICNRMLVV